MMLSRFSVAVFAASAASFVASFAPTPSYTRPFSVSDDARVATTLFISSWGQGPGIKVDDPEDGGMDIQSYLEEAQPVEARDCLDGCCLVSGFANSEDRSDQFVFDLLNHEESAFEFDKIIAFVDDEKSAKKRLLSRSARYTGLLDILDFKEAAIKGALPVAAQLEGVNSWLAAVESKGDLVSQVQAIAELAKDASDLEHVSVMVTSAAGESISASDRASVVDALKDTGKEYTLLVLGKIMDYDEGKVPYKFCKFDATEDGDVVLPEDAEFSRQEAIRMLTETLQLNAGSNKALTISEVLDANATDAKLIKGLREAGYARCQEIDHMLREGPENFQKVLEEFEEKNPYKPGSTEKFPAWYLDPAFQEALKDPKNQVETKYVVFSDEKEDEKVVKKTTPKEDEIDRIAFDWVVQKYFDDTMAGKIEENMDESEFIDMVWDEAMSLAEKKYEELQGENPDADAEFLDFDIKQKRKEQVILERAQEDLQDLLEDDDYALTDGDDDSDTD